MALLDFPVREKCVVGIDPGKSGGVCFLSLDGERLYTLPMPIIKMRALSDIKTKPGEKPKTENQYDVKALSHALYMASDYIQLVMVERVYAHAFGGKKASFGFGFGGGVLHSVLTLLELPHEYISPKNWQDICHFDAPVALDAKARSHLVATRVWGHKPFAINSERRLKRGLEPEYHDGTIDAALIAESGRRLKYLTGDQTAGKLKVYKAAKEDAACEICVHLKTLPRRVTA